MMTNRTDHERLYAFVQGFALLMQSGASLVRCLTTLQTDAADAKWREGIQFLHDQVMQGAMLSRVMSERSDLFPLMLVGMVRAGEVGGVLDLTLQRYADYMRRELELFGARPLDEVSRTRELALWCYKFGIMLKSGVPVLQAFETSVEHPTSDALREAVLILRVTTREGGRPSEKMAEFPDVFPEVVRQLFAIGEETGTLDDIALRLSDYLEKLDLLPVAPAPPVPPAAPKPPEPLPSPALPSQSSAAGSVYALTDSILQDAIALGASDVHLQPVRDYVRVRCRVDGTLRTVSKVAWGPEKELLIWRFKIVSGMNAAERSLPQRGRMSFRHPETGEEYNLRVMTYPFVDGESVRIRIAPQKFPFASLTDLGMTDEQAALCKRLLHQPCGIIAVAGVYGSGRTTTLYTMLKQVSASECSVVTLEDPVELPLERVNQISLNRAMGLNFAEGLRGVMRQDPDVIMVAEVTDAETMAEVVHAAATGHLLLIGVTAPDAVSALENLLRWNADAAGQTLGVIAQKLLRKVCPDCAAALEGAGCDACKGIGYRGRTAAFEILSTESPDMQRLLHARAPRSEILACALRSGMTTLAAAAARKVEEGVTTEAEARRVVADDH